MAYTLQAIVAKRAVLEVANAPLPRSVALEQDVLMVPLGEDVRRELGIPFLPLTDEGEHEIPKGIASLCAAASAGGRAVYVEAEFFGGDGTQAAVLAERGQIAGQAFVSRWAINRALEFLGVVRGVYRDEFEAIGLGAHRDTAQW